MHHLLVQLVLQTIECLIKHIESQMPMGALNILLWINMGAQIITMKNIKINLSYKIKKESLVARVEVEIKVSKINIKKNTKKRISQKATQKVLWKITKSHQDQLQKNQISQKINKKSHINHILDQILMNKISIKNIKIITMLINIWNESIM